MDNDMSLGFLAGLLKDKTDECNKLQKELSELKKSGGVSGKSGVNEDWKKEEAELKAKVAELTKKLDSYTSWYNNYPGSKKGE